MHDTDIGARPLLLVAGLTTLIVLAATPADAAPDQDPERTGREIFQTTCAACHGMDGRGAPRSQVGFDVPLPDFTDCNFATREPAADWVAIAHEGGPVRGFDHTMPSWGAALSMEELQRAVQYIRSFCSEPAWPRGELNLPRAMFTEKAYPEDEAVYTVGATTGSAMAVSHEIVYEGRLGARSQWELVVPFEMFQDPVTDRWKSGFGDVVLGLKHTLWHSLESGSILSLAGEAKLPLGDEADGIGNGYTVFESFLSYGQILPADAFIQIMVGGEVPTSADAEMETFWRAALGKSFQPGGFGRVWTPMVEVLGARAVEEGAETEWDIVPQLQVTLSTRQHIMGNVAVRLPLEEGGDPEVLVYVLWDWFDGGFFEGW